nr:Hypothetical protein SC2p2_01510 [Methylocystis sp. SC2]
MEIRCKIADLKRLKRGWRKWRRSVAESERPNARSSTLFSTDGIHPMNAVGVNRHPRVRARRRAPCRPKTLSRLSTGVPRWHLPN